MMAAIQPYFDEIVKTKDKKNACKSLNITNDQAARVFAKYANEHPEIFNFPFLLYAIDALRTSFPCT
jgi:hypothetical protein